MELNEEILQAYFNAVFYSSWYFDNRAVVEFKRLYPKEYKLLNSFYRIRSKLNYDLSIMKKVGDIQWFTLTFDNKHDRSLVATKRKVATRFLNAIFIVYEMVEEYGEDNDRYHIHGFGVYKEGKGFKDFTAWHSRQRIETLTDEKMKKKVKYLTKYAVKDLPRLRRSKRLVALLNDTQKHKGLRDAFPNCWNCRVNIDILRMYLYNEFRDKT